MVDHSKRVIAGYNDVSGGTENTINYAIKKGIEVINIFDGVLQRDTHIFHKLLTFLIRK